MKHFDQKTDGFSNGFQSLLVPILRRLQRWTKTYYRADFRLLPKDTFVNELGPIQSQRLSDRRTTIVDDRYMIPIFNSGTMIAAISLSQWHHIPQADLDRLEEIFSLVIESTIESLLNLESLAPVEHGLQLDKNPENVIRMDHYRESLQQDLQTTDPLPYRTCFNIPCFIEGPTASDILKMAIEIHDFSKRYAFLHFSELSSEARIHSSALSELGAVSIFIPEVSALEPRETACILKYLENFRTVHGPQFIGGSLFSSEYFQYGSLESQDLVKRLSVAHLRMKRKFSYYKKKGLLEFLFDGLTGNQESKGLL
jgi:hypothetical protein